MNRTRTGLSLLEVILSIAILGGAMVAIGHMFNLGSRSGTQARLRGEATRLCDMKMAELAAGVLPASSAGNTPFDNTPNWSYSVSVQPSQQTGLLVATVTVQQNQDVTAVPVSMSIVRFLPDPDFEQE